MPSFVAMLRGINVSGKNIIKMEALRESMDELRFKNIQTYIQSGNITFETKTTFLPSLSFMIQKKILKDFGFDVPVALRTVEQFKKIVRTNPFLKSKSIDPAKLHVTFLSEKPKAAQVIKLKTLPEEPDQFKILNREIFIHCPESYGNTKLSNTTFERLLSVQATTRNWKTVNTLLEMASE